MLTLQVVKNVSIGKHCWYYKQLVTRPSDNVPPPPSWDFAIPSPPSAPRDSGIPSPPLSRDSTIPIGSSSDTKKKPKKSVRQKEHFRRRIIDVPKFEELHGRPFRSITEKFEAILSQKLLETSGIIRASAADSTTSDSD
ncbi:unnamed protein product [Caenorhabditis brenneri]